MIVNSRRTCHDPGGGGEDAVTGSRRQKRDITQGKHCGKIRLSIKVGPRSQHGYKPRFHWAVERAVTRGRSSVTSHHGEPMGKAWLGRLSGRRVHTRTHAEVAVSYWHAVLMLSFRSPFPTRQHLLSCAL
ncbi:hypothetical protein BaRGS_00006527 [Batillaria attramentaria]|uniref:Uncharacterized protein n=1 Tax=Batillaria attramentaria TaxID=370345 RepID=A0ABD0LRQ5_9CAEN